ncbi:DUF6516 family protein [bacterium]|nr:DUF6516 family protein [bacterium]
MAELVSLLESSGFCENTQITETSFFSTEQFAFKIRTTIFSSLSFQIRVYYNKGHCDYSYQVFDQEPLCRWDNKEHFPEIETFPHHCHSISGSVVESPLQGNPVTDLQLVLAELNRLFNIEARPEPKS